MTALSAKSTKLLAKL